MASADFVRGYLAASCKPGWVQMLNMPEVADAVDYDANYPSLRKESRRGEGFSEVSPACPFSSFPFCFLVRMMHFNSSWESL
jgi:hypothetical protein